MYITSLDYDDYMGSVPTNFDRLLDLTLIWLRSICPQPLPTEAELDEKPTEYQDWFKKALYEQIKFLSDNSDIADGVNNMNGGFRIGNYSENNSLGKNTDQILRLSPNTYNYLVSLGLLYQGINDYDSLT